MISVDTRPERFKDAATTGRFGFAFEKISGWAIT